MNRSESICDNLLNWYDDNRRDLPWRRFRTPYGTWISETMLQQTRVGAVIPYYHRFLELFPDIASLAAAPTDLVYKAWEGLGYYSRANNLQKGAKYCMEFENGLLPSDTNRLKQIPGIGPYTSGAIASLAFGLPAPAVDGNVIRVFARLYALYVYAADEKAKKVVGEKVMESMPQERCGDFNEAIMDIGSAICTPRNPKCSVCPLSTNCDAFLLNIAEDLPLRKKKTVLPIVDLTYIVLLYEDSVYLRKRPAEGLLANLYELLHFDGLLSEDEMRVSVASELDLSAEDSISVQDLQESRHVFSHLIWQMKGYRVSIVRKSTDSRKVSLAESRSDYFFVPVEKAKDLAFPTALKAYVPEIFR